MIEKILGIDLGIASLGWSVIEHDSNNDANNKIIDCGVRLFTAAETPKEKESPNKARREARGIRRVIKRRRGRMNAIKKLCISNALLHENDLNIENGIFNSQENRSDVWQLRHDALYRALNANELARVLIHIAKHRGYKFVGDDETDEESGKVKTAGAALKDSFQKAGCLTVGEWLWKERGEQGKKRNKSGDYEISIPRDFLGKELDAIFEAQQRLGNTLASDALKKTYLDIAFFVRPMQSIKHMVGNCTYFPDEKRAPKSSPSAEQFVALGKFFATVVTDNEGNEQKIIALKSVDELMDFAISKDKLDFKQLRKFLALGEHQIFKGLTYKGKPKKQKKGEEDKPLEWEFDKAEAEKKVWISLKGHAKFKEVLGEEKFAALLDNIDQADEVATILTYYKDAEQKQAALKKLSLETDTIESLSTIGFSDFNQLSLRAIKAVLPEMRNGKRYDEAIAILGKPANEKSIFLPPLKDTDINILNPTVIRAFAQFRKVANALVKKYGSFDKVHFELAREVNTKADIKGMIEGQRKNEKEREAAKIWIAENFGSFIPATRKNILKKRLYEQQDGRCAYTGDALSLERLFDEGYCEIDHILPRSRSADDSFANKVLCMTKANQDKTNRTPYEWFGHDTARWETFEARIGSSSSLAKMGKGKVSRLLKNNFDENSEKEFLSRNLNDTRYMSKAIKNYCEEYWQLAHDDDKLRIQVRSGKLTSALRHQWGLDSKNRDTHTHHAADAIMIAFSTQAMVKRLSDYYGAKETNREKERPKFKAPMENFRENVETALTLERTETVVTKDGREVTLKRLLISRPPRASVTGAAHKETIQSPTAYKGRGVAVNEGKGMCDNGDMPRVDVFTKDGKYYLVPIYIADFAKADFSDITAYGLDLAEDSKFLFSIHKDDIVGINTKATANKPAKEVRGYFTQMIGPSILLNSFDNDEATFFRYDKNKKKFVCQLNVLNAIGIKKYTIDPLGYYHEVRSEKRLGTIPQESKKRKKIKIK
ncbi:MAG: type II CRISPR RNA-guided endonuclease Cas9 [Campylobacterales bacterium]|nr:type II CRISPR RNA-guided endonuclease Cas9 [Campylobacterales bacterium]